MPPRRDTRKIDFAKPLRHSHGAQAEEIKYIGMHVIDNASVHVVSVRGAVYTYDEFGYKYPADPETKKRQRTLYNVDMSEGEDTPADMGEVLDRLEAIDAAQAELKEMLQRVLDIVGPLESPKPKAVSPVSSSASGSTAKR